MNQVGVLWCPDGAVQGVRTSWNCEGWAIGECGQSCPFDDESASNECSQLPGLSGVSATVEPDDDDRWDDIARLVMLVMLLAFFAVFVNKYR